MHLHCTTASAWKWTNGRRNIERSTNFKVQQLRFGLPGWPPGLQLSRSWLVWSAGQIWKSEYNLAINGLAKQLVHFKHTTATNKLKNWKVRTIHIFKCLFFEVCTWNVMEDVPVVWRNDKLCNLSGFSKHFQPVLSTYLTKFMDVFPNAFNHQPLATTPP